MKIERFEVGLEYYQSNILVNGQDVDNYEGDCFTTFEEADADGVYLASSYDPEWQKRNPDSVISYVRKFVCLEIDDDGGVGYATGRHCKR